MAVRKRFGQHFLHDAKIIGRIIDAIDPKPGERLIEIGPGRGALTWPLLQRTDRLDVIEIDRDLAAALAAQAGTAAPGRKLQIHLQDALRTDFNALRGDGPKLRIVGNLPYNISTPLLFHLLESREAIADMHFMLQKEVVDRIVAAPGGKEYGRLGVMLSVFAQSERLFDVGRGSFHPPPKVTSAVLRLTPSVEPRHPGMSAIGAKAESTLRRVVTAAFSHRRKTLRNALSGLVEAQAMSDCGIDPQWRPEVLTPAQFVQLAARAIPPPVQVGGAAARRRLSAIAAKNDLADDS
jgi:16S rRNA (adenine1518-N6/adenine1519-N6)-dimethyltransferase